MGSGSEEIWQFSKDIYNLHTLSLLISETFKSSQCNLALYIVDTLLTHFYCGFCKAYVGRSDDIRIEKQANCQICGRDLADNRGKFVEAPLLEQLRKFYNGEHLNTLEYFTY